MVLKIYWNIYLHFVENKSKGILHWTRKIWSILNVTTWKCDVCESIWRCVISFLGLKGKSQVASLPLHLWIHCVHRRPHVFLIIIKELGQRTTHTHTSALLLHSLKRNGLKSRERVRGTEAYKVRRSYRGGKDELKADRKTGSSALSLTHTRLGSRPAQERVWSYTLLTVIIGHWWLNTIYSTSNYPIMSAGQDTR